MESNKIVFVFPSYPDVMYSFLLSFAKRFDGEIEIFCLNPILKEREGLYVEDELGKYATVTFCPKDDGKDAVISDMLARNREAVFVFGGFLGDVGHVLSMYNASSGKKGIVVTEKPSIRPTKRFKRVIRLLKKIKTKRVYSGAYKAFKESIQAVLVTGEKGVNQLRGYGIPDEKLYNFMYTHIDEDIQSRRHKIEDKVKFVYVGRFNYLNRGMDSLMYAFSDIPYKNWSLDLVGGYGEDADEIIAWAEKNENVNYGGSWKSNEVINNLQDYDVCISPTRIDGWRIQVNQAILAGIGTITTEEAISDELVKKSDSGAVVDAFKPKALREAVLRVLENPQLVEAWKDNTVEYRSCISNERIAEYFDEIIGYAVEKNNKDKPRCPWL